MKVKSYTFLLVAAFMLLGAGCGSGMEDIKDPEGYSLVWNDEFDTENTLSESEWRFETGKTGWGNNELQNYVAGLGEDAAALVEGGILKITAKKRKGEVISARINTKKSWLYGYFKARLKLPRGKGTWPAFWMLPEDFVTSPDDGEIDIMEAVGYEPGWVHTGVHTKNYTGETVKNERKNIPTAQSDFHVYAVEWTPDFIKGYVDDELFFEFLNDYAGNKDTWPFNKPFYLKLNLAWGGKWGGLEGTDESCLPALYEIDYVRVYQIEPKLAAHRGGSSVPVSLQNP
ncbi:MAG: glycoside hydrolase family 16 protein [Treponema sp.]|jgi:beta-glucanase (GH16 family)|nr:glycoside hydrolase family 16 protein [Treponema sp.]